MTGLGLSLNKCKAKRLFLYPEKAINSLVVAIFADGNTLGGKFGENGCAIVSA